MVEEKMLGDRESVQLGHWYYLCCEEDLSCIQTKEELMWVRADMLKDVGDTTEELRYFPLVPKVFETKEEALRYLRE